MQGIHNPAVSYRQFAGTVLYAAMRLPQRWLVSRPAGMNRYVPSRGNWRRVGSEPGEVGCGAWGMSEGCLRDWKLDVAVRGRRCNLTRWNRTDGTVQPPIRSASKIAAQRPNSVTAVEVSARPVVLSAGFDCIRNSRPVCDQIVIRMGGVPRNIRRGLRAGDLQQPACREAAIVAAVVSEHRRNGGSGRVRLRRGLCRDGLLIRPYGNPPHVEAGPGNAVSGSARRLDRRHRPARFSVHAVKERQ